MLSSHADVQFHGCEWRPSRTSCHRRIAKGGDHSDPRACYLNPTPSHLVSSNGSQNLSWSTCTYTAIMARNYTWPLRTATDLNLFCSFPQTYLGSQQQRFTEEAMRCSYSYPVGPMRGIQQSAINVNDFSALAFRPSHFGDNEQPIFHPLDIPYRAAIPDQKFIIAPSLNCYGVPSPVGFPTVSAPVDCLYNHPSHPFPCPSGIGRHISASAPSAFASSTTASPAPHCPNHPTSNHPVSSLKQIQTADFTDEDSSIIKSLVKTFDPIVKVVQKCNTNPRCIHNKRKTLCLLCCGGSICEHKIQRYWCRLCGGGARCSHGKQKSRCKVCGGGGYCEHDRLRFRCRLCKSAKAAKLAALNP